MSVKLSELLEAGASLLSLEAENFEECGADDYSRQAADEAKALRAIAPALVEAMKAAVGRHIEIEDHNALCSACRLARILSEAGVTCE